MPPNDWNEHKLLVMDKLKEIAEDTKSNSKEIVSLKVEVAKIAAKVGTLSGVVGAAAIEGIRFFAGHMK